MSSKRSRHRRARGDSVEMSARLALRMSQDAPVPPGNSPALPLLWCPACNRSVENPLVCGDCSAVICRVCGTPLESPDELAFG
jgi:hypothetical protein